MTATYPAHTAGRGSSDEPAVATRGLARGLGLAAAPTFATMALLTAVLDGGSTAMLCSAGHGSGLTGMVPMYLLMGLFHSSPWLRLLSGRRRGS